MATRKRKTTKQAPRRRASGGTTPPAENWPTEEQQAEALRVLRAAYYQDVRGIVVRIDQQRVIFELLCLRLHAMDHQAESCRRYTAVDTASGNLHRRVFRVVSV